MPAKKPTNVKQVQLPGGKVIEVVTFAEPAAELAGAAAAASAPSLSEVQAESQPGLLQPEVLDLHICPCCGSDFVYPTDWVEAGPVHWEVSRRCPQCEWRETEIFEQTVVERFDAELDRGAEILLHDLQQLTHANMAEDVERFIDALHADYILPSDF